MRILAPNLITLLALCAGLTAIRLAFEGRFELALGAIVFAAVLDGIDGRLARLLKGTSRFGAELDSLADFVNFGVAPGLILYFWGLHDLKSAGWIAAMVFAICAGLRLARFNVMLDDPDRPLWAANFFVGMPAPAGAITVLLPIYASFLGLARSEVLIWATLIYTVSIAALMVSRLPVFSGKRFGTRVSSELVGPLIVFVVLFIALLIAYPWVILTAGDARLSRRLAVRLSVLSRLPAAGAAKRGGGGAATGPDAATGGADGEPDAAVRARRTSAAPQLSRIAGAVAAREVELNASCPPHASGFAHGVGGGAGGAAFGARRIWRRSRSSCIITSPRFRACTTGSWRRGRASSKRIPAAASASTFFPRCSSAARRRSSSTSSATAPPTSSGRRRATPPAASRKSRCSSCRSSRRAGRWCPRRRSRISRAANLKDEFRDIHPLCFSCRDRGVLHAKRAIQSIADIKDLKLHVQNPLAAAAMAALGAQGVPMPVPQVPMALTQHVIDGCLDPWGVVAALKLYDLKFHTEFGDRTLSTTAFVLAMNREIYDRLPRDLKAVVDANAGAAAAAMAGAMWDADAATAAGAARERGDGFIMLSPEEALRWRKSTEPVVAAWLKQMKERHVDGGKLLAGAHKLIAKYAAEPEPQPPQPPEPQPQSQIAQPAAPPPADQGRTAGAGKAHSAAGAGIIAPARSADRTGRQAGAGSQAGAGRAAEAEGARYSAVNVRA